ncbi:Plastocyanin [Halogranum rubrum]|uniref:Plastocyanin n=1 Tax=Halogranum rubrum TaxID=553466 RepID=A0A1I4EV50_9EURY|nr:plastocyanin/azurin family copper-binding protein [Halogranum rubrum]SFL08407.1 Plastocyanin [Halogranum rubrum]
MQRRTFLASVGTAGLTAVAGCAGVGGSQGDILMRATAFDPYEFTVSVGDTVTWYNGSSRGHTVTAYENAIPDDAEYFASGGYENEQAAREAFRQEGFDGGGVVAGETYSHTFEVPGRYEYVCVPHEQAGMVGTIIVEE